MMATLRKRTETERGHKYEHTELVPVEYKNGQPVRYQVIDDAPDTLPAVIDDAPIVSPIQTQVVRSSSHVEGSWSDRARAFNISTLNLSIVTGILFTIAAIVFGASLSLFVLALYFFGGFTVAWLIAYLLHTAISSEGAQLYEVARMWNFLDREQRERHRRMGAPDTTAPGWVRTVLFAAAVGSTALFALLVLAAVFMENAPR